MNDWSASPQASTSAPTNAWAPDADAVVSAPAPPMPPARRQPPLARSVAELILCSGYPTQLLVAYALLVLGLPAQEASGDLSLAYIVWLSLADAALLLGLIFLFLFVDGESPRRVLLGSRPVSREVFIGVLLLPLALVIVGVTAFVIQRFAPDLHLNVNPFQTFFTSRANAAIFAVVALVVGGLREEIQRGFILHRCDTLGSATAGLVIFSILFGLGHVLQGWDAAIITGGLGAFWGIIYLRRRSVIAPAVCHGLFNLLQVLVIGQALSQS